MSKRRSVILSVVLEGRSQADTARMYAVSPGWVSKLVARYRTEGDTAFEPRSRRPKTSPTRLSDVLINQIVNLRVELTAKGLDAGAETIRWHLEQHHHVKVSTSTIRRHLITAGLITAEPRKRPKSSYIRFEADLPNEMWQTDMTHWALANGTGAEILTWLDDHSRYALGITTHPRVTTAIVVNTFTQTVATHGIPASVLSDNGLYYTARFARGGRSGPNRFETTLTNAGVQQKHSKPNHPTTCGKVERFQQTLKRWLTSQPAATTHGELQTQLDAFAIEYNQRRPHRSLQRATPHTAYTRLPKATPDTNPQTTHRIRHDRIDTSGVVTLRHNSRLHHIGIGRAHANTPIVMLIADRDIRIIATTTGELLRHLTLDPTTDYQPQTQTRKTPEP